MGFKLINALELLFSQCNNSNVKNETTHLKHFIPKYDTPKQEMLSDELPAESRRCRRPPDIWNRLYDPLGISAQFLQCANSGCMSFYSSTCHDDYTSTVHLLLKCSYERTHSPCYIFPFQLQSVIFNHKDYYNLLLVVLIKRQHQHMDLALFIESCSY